MRQGQLERLIDELAEKRAAVHIARGILEAAGYTDREHAMAAALVALRLADERTAENRERDGMTAARPSPRGKDRP